MTAGRLSNGDMTMVHIIITVSEYIIDGSSQRYLFV